MVPEKTRVSAISARRSDDVTIAKPARARSGFSAARSEVAARSAPADDDALVDTAGTPYPVFAAGEKDSSAALAGRLQLGRRRELRREADVRAHPRRTKPMSDERTAEAK